MLDFVFKNYTSQKSPNRKFFKDILDIGIEELQIKDKNVEVSLNLVSEARIKELNKKHRHKNKATDVLSFPLNEKIESRLLLGDIFICLSFAKKQTKSENTSMEGKIAQLTVHGLLHLLGYD